MSTTTTRPFPYREHITAMCIGYKNPDGSLIAEKLMPYVKVDSHTYRYNVFPEETNYSIPENMEVGRVSETPEIRYTATNEKGGLATYAIEILEPRIDEETPADFDVTSEDIWRLLNVHDLHHEVAVAELLRNPDTYPVSNQMLLTGDAKFNHPDMDIISLIENKKREAIMPYNTFSCGDDVWLEISRNPTAVRTILGNASTRGRITKSEFAEVLGLKNIIVGEGRVNISLPGEEPVLKRCWEKDALLLYLNPLTVTTQSFAFGITAEHKSGRKILHDFYFKKGPTGSDVYRCVHSRMPHVMAPKLGFLFKGAV
jgi:hypothetical protein